MPGRQGAVSPRREGTVKDAATTACGAAGSRWGAVGVRPREPGRGLVRPCPKEKERPSG